MFTGFAVCAQYKQECRPRHVSDGSAFSRERSAQATTSGLRSASKSFATEHVQSHHTDGNAHRQLADERLGHESRNSSPQYIWQ